jgi:Domain of unknown function (DUF4338)
MEAIFSYRHRHLTEADIAFIRDLIAAHPKVSRRQLSTKLCQAWNWVQANGALRDMVCRGLMLELHRAGLIELPPIVKRPCNPLARRSRPALVEVDQQPLQGGLSEIREQVRVCQVRRTPDEAVFNSLLEQYHYLGYTQPVGEQLKYLVYANERPIACVAWSSAPRHLGCRDRFIGWSAEARRRNICLIAYNTRFLVLPWVVVPHLASHVLSRMAKVLSGDWERRYGHPIYFLETFVDPQRFRGTCYVAANWTRLGRTTGRGKDAPSHKPTRALKDVLGYPLVKDFRQRLSHLVSG